MTIIRQHRETPDLVQMIADLTDRVRTLEKARRLGNASIDGGELTISGGDIVVRSDSGEEVLRIEHGAMPSIKMHPDQGLDENYAQMFAWESSGGASLELAIKNSGGGQEGGKLLLQKGSVYLSHQPSDAAETFISLSQFDSHPNHIRFRGKFITDTQISNEDAWVMGSTFVASGFGAVGIAFDHAFSTTPLIFYTITGATANFDHCLISADSSGFTIGWSGTAEHTINWMAFRR